MDTELRSHLILLILRSVVIMWKYPTTPSPSATTAPPSPAPSPAPAPPWWSNSTAMAAILGPGSVLFGLKNPQIALVDGMNLKEAVTNSSLPPLTGIQLMLAASPTVAVSPPYTPRRKMSFLTTCLKGTPILLAATRRITAGCGLTSLIWTTLTTMTWTMASACIRIVGSITVDGTALLVIIAIVTFVN